MIRERDLTGSKLPGAGAEKWIEPDGIVCLGGGDWWYHNRGHYDMQMMRHLRRVLPVLYVNSIGIRVPRPSEGRMFFRRVARKLKSWTRGLRRIEPGFAVLSPVSVPGRLGMIVSSRFLTLQIRIAARRLGMSRPLFWVTCPPWAECVPGLDPAGLVYQRTDRWEEFPHADKARIRDYDRRLKLAANVTLYCSTLLFEEEGPACPSAAYLDHGVDFEKFAAAGMDLSSVPEDLRGIERPRVGFIGGIDSHTFDPKLFLEAAASLPDVRFVLVGACSLPDGWCDLSNVTLLGQKPYEDVPAYMAACDVLIMPWNRNRWIEACNPVKLKEYLAVGRPVVSTPFPELDKYSESVRVAGDAQTFAEEIRRVLDHPCDAEALRARVRDETWESRAKTLLGLLERARIRTGAPNDR